MEKTYITPEYKQQLDNLAETLMTTWREKNIQNLGQLALFELNENVIRSE